MNSKGEAGVGILLTVAVAVIIGLAMMQGTAFYQGQTQNLQTVRNSTITLPASGSSLEIAGFAALDGSYTPDVINITDGTTVPASNYTFQSKVSSVDGQKSLFIKSNGGFYASQSVNITFVGQPDGYIADSGTRSVAALILVFFGLAIAAVALIPSLRSGLIDF